MKKRKLTRKQIIMIVSILILFIGTIVLINQHTSTKQTEEKLTSAFNPKVPEAHLNNRAKNKLELYMEAMKDSVQHANERLKDPYITGRDTIKTVHQSLPPAGRSVFNPAVGNVDANEAKVNDRLNKILKELNKPVETNLPASKAGAPANMPIPNPDIERIEKLLQNLNTNAGPDPDLQKIDTLVTKLLQLQTGQSPATFHNQTKGLPSKKILPVASYPITESEASNSPEIHLSIGFYGLEDGQTDSSKVDQTSIKALVNNEQVVQDGSTIQLRLEQDMYIKDILIPAGQLIAGYATIANERVELQINSIMYNNTVYPVQLVVYDLDGLRGINVPGAVTVECARQGLNNAVQSMDVYAPVDNIGAQVAVSGIQAAKGLIGKKLRKVQATLKAGHEVLLKTANF